MQTQFEIFAQQLRAQFPDARVDLTSFPSRAQTLALVWRGHLWVCDYVPSHNALGVQEVTENDAFTSGYEHVFSNFDAAQQKLVELVSICRQKSLLAA